jgi:hypothetical protein
MQEWPMSTRYNVVVEREEYEEATGKVTGRAEYRIDAYGLLQEAWDAVQEQVEKLGWFDDR